MAEPPNQHDAGPGTTGVEHFRRAKRPFLSRSLLIKFATEWSPSVVAGAARPERRIDREWWQSEEEGKLAADYWGGGKKDYSGDGQIRRKPMDVWPAVPPNSYFSDRRGCNLTGLGGWYKDHSSRCIASLLPSSNFHVLLTRFLFC